MSDWKAAMICLLPLLAAGSPVRLSGFPVPYGPKLRTWLVLFGAAVVGMVVQPENIPAFAAIDAVAGWLVLAHPRGDAQRAIGLLFVSMLFIHIGFFIACWLQPGAHDFVGYATFNRLLGWLQLACLASWGAGDVLGNFVHRVRDSRNSTLARDGV